MRKEHVVSFREKIQKELDRSFLLDRKIDQVSEELVLSFLFHVQKNGTKKPLLTIREAHSLESNLKRFLHCQFEGEVYKNIKYECNQ